MSRFHTKLVILLLLTAAKGVMAQTTITHDISVAPLIIAGNSTNNYIITGTTTTNYVEVQTGYRGLITLRNLTITLTSGNNPPIAIKGQNKGSNLTPITNVDILLEGNNVLSFRGTSSPHAGAAAFQVELGAQINISENPCYPGTLTAEVTNSGGNLYGGAGIGSANRGYNNTTDDAIDTVSIIGNNCPVKPIAGGNIVISGGTITARGNHGAGIGGAYQTYYDGMIVVYGGTVNASALYHAAGLGSGCPNGSGVISCYTPNSAIIVLPPAQISATGATGSAGIPDASLGLAGTNYIIYIGDTAKPVVTVHTEDFEPYANIYADLSLNQDIANVFNATVPQGKFDIRNVKFGQTDANGLFQFHAVINNNTTFFTDATSSQASTLGRPYSPETVQLPAGGTVVLKRMLMNISMLFFPSIPLPEGYTASQAFANTCWVKIIYEDTVPMTNIVFGIAGGLTSDFLANNITFYASDSITQILPPTTLSQYDTIYAVIPLKTGKLVGYYTDVFRYIGNWNGSSTGYIRQALGQYVYFVDTTENICLGDSVLFNGQYYKETGYYYDTLQTIWGCDSIVALHLIVNFLDTTLYDTICQGDSVLFNGKYYTQTGIYTDTLQMVWGCDSIINLDLLVNFPSDTTIYDTICVTDLPYLLHDFNLSSSGYYSRVTANVVGCDSTINLYLTVTDTVYKDIEANICQGEAYTENGFNETKSGIYTRMERAVHGCDTLVTLLLTVKPKPVFEITTEGDVCRDGKIELSVNIDSAVYQWSTEDTTQRIYGFEEGFYSVTVSVEGCQTEQKIEIICPCSMWLPNIFTPNSNGISYVYLPVLIGELYSFQMVIYNRWGMEVFRTNTFLGWNGKTNGRDASAGVYFCVVEYTCKYNSDKKYFANSSVTVVR